MRTMFTAFALSVATCTFANGEQYFTYDDFIRQVESGNIQSVTLDQFSSISGTMVEGREPNTFRSYADTGTANDTLLTRLLKEHGVSVSIQDESKPFDGFPILVGCISFMPPIVCLILLIVINTKLTQILANQLENRPVFQKNNGRLS